MDELNQQPVQEKPSVFTLLKRLNPNSLPFWKKWSIGLAISLLLIVTTIVLATQQRSTSTYTHEDYLPSLTTQPSETPIRTPTPSPSSQISSPSARPTSSFPPTLTPAPNTSGGDEKKVLAIIFDPILENGQRLTIKKGWSITEILFSQTIDFLKRVSAGNANYKIVDRIDVNSGWPQKIDGFSYNEDSYLAAINGSTHHEPDTVDYLLIINTYDVCGKLNRGEIDELWLMGGPWFGFYESRLAGSGAYQYNSPPLGGTSCNKLLPIMGFSYERSYEEMVHDFGHRTEATMAKVYGSWAQNRMEHNWDKFALTQKQSPNFTIVGCGSIHFPPNTTVEYVASDAKEVDSYCDDFLQYPNLSTSQDVKKTISCSAWGCTMLGFYDWWFRHIPRADGVGPDGKLNNWWEYIVDPNKAL